MDNTHKLLLAFIEASGFNVEETFEQKFPSGQILTPQDYKVTKRGPVNMRTEGFNVTFIDGKWQ